MSTTRAEMGAVAGADARSGKWISKRRYAAGAVSAAIACLLVFGAASAPASQTHLFIEAFGSAEEVTFSKSGGTGAVTRVQSTGDLLVVDIGAQTIRRFKADGTPHDFSALGSNTIDAKAGAGGKACGEEPASCDRTPQNRFTFTGFPAESQIAVDESGGPTDGDIYVAQGNQVAGHLVDIFAPSGEYLGQLTAAGGTAFGAGGFPFGPCGVAADTAGDLLVGGGFDEQLYRFKQPAVPHDPLENGDGSVISSSLGQQPCNIAVGAGPTAGALFVATAGFVLKLDAAGGEPEYVIDNGESTGGVQAAAVNPDNGHLYIASRIEGSLNYQIQEYDASGSSQKLLSTTPRGKAVAAAGTGTEERVYVSDTEDTLRVYGPRVTLPEPETGEATEIEEPSVVVNGTVNPDGEALTECYFVYRNNAEPSVEFVEPCVESVAAIGAGRSPVPVHAKLEGLPAEAEFTFRLFAANANAALYPAASNAVVSNNNSVFSTPAKPLVGTAWATSVSTDSASIRARINPKNLSTTYRFEWGSAGGTFEHSTAEIALGSDAVDHTVGHLLSGLAPGATYRYRVVATNNLGTVHAERTLTTFRIGKPEGGDCSNRALRTGPSATLPDCRAYELVSPLEKGNGDVISPPTVTGYSAEFTQASSQGGGLAYSSYRAFLAAEGAPYVSMYRAGRGASGWSTEAISPPQGVTRGSTTVYDNGFLAATENLSRSWFYRVGKPALTPDAPEGFENVYRRESGDGAFEPLNTVTPPHPARGFQARLQGLTADGSQAVFAANDNLTSDARVNNISQLYLSSVDAPLRLVSVLPDGTSSKADSVVAGTSPPVVSPVQAMRRGSFTHALSEDGSRLYFTTRDILYLRTNPAEEQSAIVGDECTEPAKACTVEIGPGAFRTAAADGSRMYFSSGNTLYEYVAATGATTTIGGPINLLLGSSRDATSVYFTSRLVLAEGGSNGEPNVYMHEVGEPLTFVATLGTFDYGSSTLENAFNRTARVTPDGRHLAFMSTSRPTGYDNTDARTGEATKEVFLYEAGGELVCVSCNPSGARPVGKEMPEAFRSRYGDERVAAFIPGWRTSFYAPRALSDDGSRLFFTSADALSPYDTNGFLDVYEWERPGKGDCTASSPTYSSSSGGCVSLISSGEGKSDSEFLDADPGGDEVFFSTGTSLVPADYGLVDIYVAKVGGGFPQPTPAAAECEGDACQGPAAPPRASTPASLDFQGSGNLAPPSECGAISRRAQGLIRRSRGLRSRAQRLARRPHGRAQARRLARKGRRLARRAHGLSKRSKRCRRAERRAGR